jgi:tetratricopeptide (TPR) repeat protein
MKTRNAVILAVLLSIVSIAFTYLIVSALQTNKQRVQIEEKLLTKETTPAPTAPAPAQPAVDKAAILAIFDVNAGDRQKTVEAFKKYMRDVPPYVITGTKGYPEALNGEYEKAIQTSQWEINDNPDVVGPRYTLAWIYARIGNYDRALAVCDETLKRGPEFNKVRYIKLWVLAKQGKYEDALRTCKEALGDDPSSAELYYAKGRIQDLAGNNDDAIASYTQAISLKPDFFEANVYLGMLYTQLGRYDEAIKMQNKAIDIDRYAPGGYLGLGIVYELMGNYEAALTQYKNAVQVGTFGTNANSPQQPSAPSIGIDYAFVYNRIGVLNDRVGSYQDALIAFKNALAARPGYDEACRGLTLTYLLLDNRESALSNYAKLKNINPAMAASIASLVEPGK